MNLKIYVNKIWVSSVGDRYQIHSHIKIYSVHAYLPRGHLKKKLYFITLKARFCIIHFCHSFNKGIL